MTDTNIVILGTSSIGLSLALACVRAGQTIVVCEPDGHARERAVHFAAKTDPQRGAALTLIAGLEEGRAVDLVIDAVPPEDRDEFMALAKYVAAVDVPVLSIWPDPGWTGVAPQRLVRLVPFQPMELRALTEIVPFAETLPQVAEKAESFARLMGRVPVPRPVGGASIGMPLGLPSSSTPASAPAFVESITARTR